MTDKVGRLRTAMDRDKAFRQYDDFRRTNRLKEALIVAETTDGKFHVLAQMTTPAGAARLCMVAAEALAQVPEDKRGVAPPPPPKPAPPKATPQPTGAAKAPVLHTVAAAWSGFEQSIFDDDVGPVQRREMRRAFYPGVHILLETITTMLEPGDEMTDADLQKMTDLDAELRRFAIDLREGRA